MASVQNTIGVNAQLNYVSCIQMYGKQAPWEDPTKWIKDTFPWNTASSQRECPALLQLRPEDVGYDGYATAKEVSTSKNVPENDKDGDPLVCFLVNVYIFKIF